MLPLNTPSCETSGKTEADGGGSDPAVAVVQLVPEGVPGPGAVGPQLGADEDHLVVGLQHGEFGDRPSRDHRYLYPWPTPVVIRLGRLWCIKEPQALEHTP